MKCNLNGFIEKYGTEDGTKRYNDFRNKISKARKGKKTFVTNLNGFIEKYGTEDGTKRYNDFRNKAKTTAKNRGDVVSLNAFIKKYNTEDGTKRYNEMILKKKKNVFKANLNGFIEKYGTEDGTKLFNNFRKNVATNEDKFIKLYGEIEGVRRWKNWTKRQSDSQKIALSKKGFIERYGEIEGIKKRKEWIENLKLSHKIETYIKKYGTEDGIKLYKKHIKNKKTTTCFYSKISQLLFFDLLECIEDKENVFFAEHGKEKSVEKYRVDFCYNNKIIEFNGDIWHGNPTIYKSNDTPNPFDKKLTSKDIWLKDKNRIDILKQNGYIVHVVWENDYNLYKEKAFNDCLNFILKD